MSVKVKIIWFNNELSSTEKAESEIANLLSQGWIIIIGATSGQNLIPVYGFVKSKSPRNTFVILQKGE